MDWARTMDLLRSAPIASIRLLLELREVADMRHPVESARAKSLIIWKD